MRLEPDVEASGARYKGVIFQVRFDGEKIDSRVRHYNRKLKWKRIPGYNGSRAALCSPRQGGRYFSIHVPMGSFRVTGDTWLCAAWLTSNGRASNCMVRLWPERKKHPNHWLRRSMPANRWNPKKLPLVRFGLQEGFIATGVSFGSRGPGERHVAVDDFCLIRGADTRPPSAVPALKAQTTPDGGVRLSWGHAKDDICVAAYIVYWANVPELEQSEDEIVCRTSGTEFTHAFVPHPGDWYYAVAAEDLFGNVGPPSRVVKVVLPE
jgi:hypothetical protein